MLKVVTSQFRAVKQNAQHTRYMHTFLRAAMLSYIPQSNYTQKIPRFLKTHHCTISQGPKIICCSITPISQARKKMTLRLRGYSSWFVDGVTVVLHNTTGS